MDVFDLWPAGQRAGVRAPKGGVGKSTQGNGGGVGGGSERAKGDLQCVVKPVAAKRSFCCHPDGVLPSKRTRSLGDLSLCHGSSWGRTGHWGHGRVSVLRICSSCSGRERESDSRPLLTPAGGSRKDCLPRRAGLRDAARRVDGAAEAEMKTQRWARRCPFSG